MKVIKKNLTFGTAMNALLKGYKITRSIWSGYWFIDTPSLINAKPVDTDTPLNDSDIQPMNRMIIAKLRNHNGYSPAQPYQVDMLAHDWEIIK